MIAERIRAGAQAMGIELPAQAPEQFAAYHRLLEEGNRRMNLTRVLDDPAEAVDRHYLDSIAPLAIPGLFEPAKTLIDVGTGAGFPGIPLAIARPDLKITLLDSLKKRVDFLSEVIAELGLNAVAVHARAEDAARLPEFRDAFDLATARAVAALNVLAEWTLPFVKPGGRMLAYKGPTLDEELTGAQAAIDCLQGRAAATHLISIPGRDWDHRLLVIDKLAATPKRFPRKPGEAAKKPLQ